MEKVRYEHCPECGSTDLKNIFYLNNGEPTKVYCRCAVCKAFVARYTLSRYTSNKCYESLLRMLKVHTGDSRKIAKEIESFCQDVKDEYNRTLKLLEEKGEESKSIEELMTESEKDK
ncbi:hypothetical protein JXI42_04710 [bacterium]|nr:hypothetical protein [bacterium]